MRSRASGGTRLDASFCCFTVIELATPDARERSPTTKQTESFA
jgi:hypothetical protein